MERKKKGKTKNLYSSYNPKHPIVPVTELAIYRLCAGIVLSRVSFGTNLQSPQSLLVPVVDVIGAGHLIQPKQ